MMKQLPEGMFINPDQTRFSILRNWVLDHAVTEISMNERQFWNFVHLQPVAEKPWTTYMGRAISVRDMPSECQKRLGFPGLRQGEI
ncbi:MAG TPA: hypothetical protein VMH84_00420 [Xanthobacteraceae bacterium]|nr:hypothetical protein [Xanthobacteraceae bacterium]